MKNNWKKEFHELFFKGVKRYEAGRQSPEEMFKDEEAIFLNSIGCSTQEMFDFCDDYVRWGDVIYEHVEELQAVRYEHFTENLDSQPAATRMRMDEFPAKNDEIEGILWLPRLILKARAKLAGTLPADLMYGWGGDRKFFREKNVNPAELLRVTQKSGESNQPIIDYIKGCISRLGK